jgi:hypothetical protein
MADENKRQKPDWKVLTKRGEALGSQIGVGFNHKAGQGITILMDAQPLPNKDGQLELVVFPIQSNE